MRVARILVSIVAALALVAGASVGGAVLSSSAQAGARSAPEAPSGQAAGPAGIREAAWAPDGRRVVVSWFDAIWTMTPDGREARRLVTRPEGWVSERDPAWSPDGRSIAFSANLGGTFDIWMVPAAGGAARRLTTDPGDERWPSWTRDGRIVYSARMRPGAWQLFAVTADGSGTPVRLTPDAAAEWQGRVSPDGRRVAFISDRDPQGDDGVDVWVRELPGAGAAGAAPAATRLTEQAGAESHPAWSPDGGRVAYFAARAGAAGIWVSALPVREDTDAAGRGGRGAVGRGGFGRGRGAAAGPPPGSVVLASRHAGVPAWSPDGETLLIATFPTGGTGGYNGNPHRIDDDPPLALAGAADSQFWRVQAPRAVDAGAATLGLPAPASSRWTTAFDQVWQTLKSLYYGSGESAAAWDALGARYRPEMVRVADAAGAREIIDRLLAEQPLMKPAVSSRRAVIASGHPLASAAGARILEQGGNVVDAGIAVSFALGVVEPDASGLGGDGQAMLFLRGMREPVVVEYKDMTPSRATSDNPRLFNPNGTRTAPDGPSVVAIPGTVAGLDLLYEKYGSRTVTWADLLAPAVTLAEEGYLLDEALPTTIAEGRASFEKYPEAARIFLPGGRVPQPGDRFVNRDYAETLRVLAKEGGQSFYRGTIARRIADDMAASGGVISLEDLAQYRAMERQPLVADYRGYRVYAAPPPVSTGLQLAETLQILGHYQPRPGATATTDADYFHHVIDAWRVRDGGARIADPERWPVDLGNHLDPAHALERFRLINPARAFTGQGGRGGGPGPGSAGSTGLPDPAAEEGRRVQTGTTSFVVADAEGNLIAFTQTLSTWGGNYYVSKGLGFLYNDHFRGGRGGTGFGATLPLMRTSTTSAPTLVFAPAGEGAGESGVAGFTPRLAVGAAGNAWIPASVYSIILNVIDGGLPAQRAIEAPRFLIGSAESGSRVQIEDRFPRAVLADLEARGHTFVTVGRPGEVKYGYAALAVVDVRRGVVEGGAEPRRSHATAAPGGGTDR